MKLVVGMVMGLGLVLPGTRASAAPVDCAAARCTIQAAIDAECSCADAKNHGRYTSCVARVVNRAAHERTIPKKCRGKINGCAIRSLCGKRSGVVLCDLPGNGVSGRCRPLVSEEHCTKRGGTIVSSCCDTCGGAPTPSPSATGPTATPETPEPTATATPSAAAATATPEEPVATATPEEPVATATVETPVATATPEEPIATATAEVPVETATPEEPVPTATIEEPVPTATPEVPTATATIEEPVPTATPEEPTATATVEEPVPTATLEEPTATATPEEPSPTPTPVIVTAI